MDGNLQDDPEATLTFIQHWKQGYDVVYALRIKRKEHWLKRLACKIFYYLQTNLPDIKLPGHFFLTRSPSNSSFKTNARTE